MGTPTAPTPEQLPDPVAALELLSGDAQTFLTKVWASRTHFHHADPDALSALLTFDDVDLLLTGTAIRTPAVRIAKDGSVLPSSSYTRSATLAGQPLSGLVDPRKVFALFDDGATVVLQGLHRYWAPLGALVTDLELALGHPCQANAYLTPPGSQGFAVHKDTHDVFVFQTHGSKVWEVHPAEAAGGDPQTVVLEPGVCMYLPTGTPHAARAEETASLHVTIGINQLTWRQVLERALDAVLEETGAQHLPAGYLDDPAVLADGLEERLHTVAAALEALDPRAVADGEVRRFLTGRSLSQRGGLRDRLAARDLTDTTRLRRRAGHPCVLLPEGDRLRVLLGDRELTMPARLAAPLEEIRSAGTFRPADLAGHLDEQSRLVVCRRLVREGLLEVLG
ncbi:MAG: bifunctional lysine-specific demethylase and histidyl-hydroxylase [Nocardioidaceae bacterium]|nr:bifunctional lysine-specific demethylase and histidyl-hydroxylase [Nocardioidaceae bacterium]